MAILTVQNLTEAPVHVGDLYTTLQPNAPISTKRFMSDLARMSALQGLIQAGSVAVSVELSPEEKASGLLVPRFVKVGEDHGKSAGD